MITASESTEISSFGGNAGTFSKVTDVQEGRVRAYRLAHQKTLDDVAADLNLLTEAKKKRSAADMSENRYFLSEVQREVVRNALTMEQAAKAGEPQDLATEAMELCENLRDLWQLRNLRSEEWGTVLNFLQTALAGEVFEGFNEEKCHAIRLVVERHLRISVSREDVEASLELLEAAGFDPWKAMIGFRE
jgi:hypothetical protein